MNVCLGGTFDPLHNGHKRLIDKAADLLNGDRLFLGLTSEEMAEGSRGGEDITSYGVREAALEQYLRSKGIDFKIVSITRDHGIADTDPVLDAIVVSKETYPGALAINAARADNGLNRLMVFVVDFLRTGDGTVISGTLIRKGEMDTEGKSRED